MPKSPDLTDEPNSALDDEGEKILARLVLEFKQQGSTIVAVTHRPALLSLADRLLVLQAGKAVALGPTQEVIQMFQQKQAAQASVNGEAS